MNDTTEINKKKIGENILKAATDFEESLAKYLDAEAEKLKVLSNTYDSNYNKASRYDIDAMNKLFKETLDSLNSIRKTIHDNMVLGESLINSDSEKNNYYTENNYYQEDQPETSEPIPDSQEEGPSFIDSLPKLESMLKDLNIDNLFTSETLSGAKEIFQQLTENLDLSSFEDDDIMKGFKDFTEK